MASSASPIIVSSSTKFLFPIQLPTSNPLSFSPNKPKTFLQLVASFPPHSSLIFFNTNSATPFVCKAEKDYKFPDPIPEFADSETEKFRSHLLSKLSKKDMFADSVDEAVGICTGILNEFLHTEYGGPGTLLVNPFINMADTINGKGLPGGPQAARAAVKWAQAHVDKDWKEWTTTH